jgi:hypothetical protein
MHSTDSVSRFDFCKNIPAEVLPALQEHLIPLEWILPPWVQRCFVMWVDDGKNQDLREGAAISASSDYAYRRLELYFFPCWLDAEPARRREMCIHDLLHAATGVLANYAREEIKRLVPEDDAPKYRSALLDELETRHEAMTQDLAFTICKFLSQMPKK